jgi:DNA repair photolyase
MMTFQPTLYGGGQEVSPYESRRALPEVKQVPRHGPVLQRSPLTPDPDVLALDIASGCAQGCIFCSTRAHAPSPAGDRVLLYSDTAQQLRDELASRVAFPRAVYLCPTTDPFMPLSAVQTAAAEVVAVLAQHRIEAWLMTRGYIRADVQKVLSRYAAFVKVTVAVTTLDPSLSRQMEPLGASPRMRLRLIRRLQAQGVPVRVALEPLLPELTDTRENLEPILQALAELGIRRISTSYAFLRPRITEGLRDALNGTADQVLSAYTTGPTLRCGALAAARFLPKIRRQHGYASVMALAAQFGMTVAVNGVTNPDFLPLRKDPISTRTLPIRRSGRVS